VADTLKARNTRVAHSEDLFYLEWMDGCMLRIEMKYKSDCNIEPVLQGHHVYVLSFIK